jgi:hypothetical protein
VLTSEPLKSISSERCVHEMTLAAFL